MPSRYIPFSKKMPFKRKKIRVLCLGPCRKRHYFWTESKFLRVCDRGRELQAGVSIRFDPAYWQHDGNDARRAENA